MLENNIPFTQLIDKHQILSSVKGENKKIGGVNDDKGKKTRNH